MNYDDVLKFTGAEVHAFESFGSYQGDWFAKVTYKNQTGWIHGYFGSCSGCDALQSEFGDAYHDCKNGDYYNPLYDGEFIEGCPECQELKVRLKDFAQGYFDQIITQEEAEAHASENSEWDLEAREVLKFIKENK